MNKRLTFFAVIEAIILLLLLMALFRNGFVFVIGLALLFSWLASRFRSRILGIISGLFWFVTVIELLKTGYFWLALAFPIVLGLLHHRRKVMGGASSHSSGFYQDSYHGFNQDFRQDPNQDFNQGTAQGNYQGFYQGGARRRFTQDQDSEPTWQSSGSQNKNELIDLSEMHFHETGNNLSIRKASGNTKILVPQDVELALNINVNKGVVNVFDKMTEINDVQIRYFTDNYESAPKRVAIMIRVDQGNVEIVRA